jgi:hypothetical protein
MISSRNLKDLRDGIMANLKISAICLRWEAKCDKMDLGLGNRIEQ